MQSPDARFHLMLLQWEIPDVGDTRRILPSFRGSPKLFLEEAKADEERYEILFLRLPP